MKQLTNNLLRLNFRGVDLNDVSKIEFAFSQNIGDEPLKMAEYPGKGVQLVAENVIGVEWTKDETALFEAGKPFYADTRITLKDSGFQPYTPILKLTMNPTLFKG